MIVVVALVSIGVIAVLYVVLAAPGWRRWGATDAELMAKYPQDEIVSNPTVRAVRAITIEAPLGDVWPWVAQIGRGAGWYAIDLIDNTGRKSADYIMDLPEPALGDQAAIGRIVSYKKGEHIAFCDQDVKFLGCTVKFCLGHVARPLDERRTRLLLIACIQPVQGRPWVARMALAVNDVMETIMGVTQLKTLKRLIESYPQRLARGDIHRAPGRDGHQKYPYAYAGEKEE